MALTLTSGGGVGLGRKFGTLHGSLVLLATQFSERDVRHEACKVPFRFEIDISRLACGFWTPALVADLLHPASVGYFQEALAKSTWQDSMLRYDPACRVSAKQTLQHECSQLSNHLWTPKLAGRLIRQMLPGTSMWTPTRWMPSWQTDAD